MSSDDMEAALESVRAVRQIVGEVSLSLCKLLLSASAARELSDLLANLQERVEKTETFLKSSSFEGSCNTSP